MPETKYVFKPDKFSVHSRILRYIQRISDQPLRILDVGTAQGYLGRELSTVGHEMYGIELETDWAAIAQSYYCEPIQIGDLDALEPRFADAFFDVIILSTVLEHVKYPDMVLRRLRRCLKPEGKIIIALP